MADETWEVWGTFRYDGNITNFRRCFGASNKRSAEDKALKFYDNYIRSQQDGALYGRLSIKGAQVWKA